MLAFQGAHEDGGGAGVGGGGAGVGGGGAGVGGGGAGVGGGGVVEQPVVSVQGYNVQSWAGVDETKANACMAVHGWQQAHPSVS